MGVLEMGDLNPREIEKRWLRKWPEAEPWVICGDPRICMACGERACGDMVLIGALCTRCLPDADAILGYVATVVEGRLAADDATRRRAADKTARFLDEVGTHRAALLRELERESWFARDFLQWRRRNRGRWEAGA
jgi:hypothetical protein